MQNALQMKYFVLSPMKDDMYGAASRNAIRTYADGIRPENPELAVALLAWVNGVYDTLKVEA